MKKTILITGGSHADIPLIEAAKKLNLYVITVGNTMDYGHQISDEYYKIDYSDKKKLLKLAKEKKITYVCPSCNDFAYFSAVFIAQALNLKNNFDDMEVAKILHRKDLFRKFVLKHNLPTPKAISYVQGDSLLEDIGYWNFPLMIKPADFCGGRGIVKVHNFESLSTSLDYATSHSREKRVVIEEFIEGTNHGFTSILENKKVKFYFVDDELYFKNKFRVAGSLSPSILSQKVIDKIIDQSEKIAKLLHLKDGIFHVQFINQKNNEPVIVEVTRRPPGDLYLDLVKYTTGVNYASLILNTYIGNDVLYTKNVTSKFILRHCIMSEANGIVNKIKYDQRISGKVFNSIKLGNIGDIINDYMTYKYGIDFLEFGSAEELLEVSKNINNLITVSLKK